MNSTSIKCRIVIVGGGGAAIKTAQGFSDTLDPAKYSVQMITDRPYCLHYPAMLRVLATSEWPEADMAFIPLDRIFATGKAGEVVVGKVLSVSERSVHLEDGRDVSYDYLVLATGTTWNGPLVIPTEPEQRGEWIDSWRRRFASAKDVVIIGGGANGVELAGELKHWYPHQNVSIVHSDKYILNDAYPAKFRQHATQRVHDLGVNLILEDRATMPSDNAYTSVTTNKGTAIKADLVIPMWGANYNTDFLRSFDPTILTSNGQIKVTPQLQVKLASGKTNVYAAGDIVDWPETNQLTKVKFHAAVIVASVLAELQGKTSNVEYKGTSEAIIIPLGPEKGFGYIPIAWGCGVTVGDHVVARMKSRWLLLPKARKVIGY